MNIYIACPECGEVTYPDAYDTDDQDEFARICNGCGKVWKMIEVVDSESTDEDVCCECGSPDHTCQDCNTFVIEALPHTVVYTLQDGDIDPDTGDVYLEEDDE
jgi:hypothetical protein